MKHPDIKHGFTLGVASIIALLVIITTFYATRSTIDKTEQRYLEQTLTELIEPNSYNNQPALDTIQLMHSSLGSDELKTIYRARLDGQATGLVISAVAPDGYNGNIDMLIGLTYEGTIVGVRVSQHNETPGLGDDIDIKRSDWIKSFDGLPSATMPDFTWQVKKDGGQFDQFTGATITPRAVVHAVHRVANWYQIERDAIFAASTNGIR